MPGNLHDLDQVAIRGHAAERQSGGLERLAVGVVELVTMPVSLVNFLAAVQLGRQRAGLEFAGLRAKSHRAALVGDVLLLVQQGNDGVYGGGVKFGGVSTLELEHVAGELDGGNLHSEAKPEVRDVVFAGVLGCQNFPLGAALAEPARHQNAAASLKGLGRAVFLYVLRVDPLYLDAAIVGHAAVDHRFVD